MIYHKVIGTGKKKVVFLHGFLESSTMWEVFALQEFEFTCILIDLPGHGKSVAHLDYKSLVEIAQDIKAHLSSFQILEFDIVGHSLGGYLGIELHKLMPGKNKLILFHSNFLEDSLQKKQDRNRVIEIVKTNKDLFIKEAIPNLFLKEFQKSEFVKNLEEEAKLISKETIIMYTELMRDRISNAQYVQTLNELFLFIQGKWDPICTLDVINEYSSKINVCLSESGHMGHFEATKVEFNFIKNFL